MRFLLRALVVALSAGLAVFAWRELRPAPPGPSAARIAPPLEEAPIPAELLAGTYQGPIHRADGSEEWIVLEIERVTAVVGAEATFQFSLSSVDENVRSEGCASLRERWIRFSGLSGEMRRRDDGLLLLRSTPIDGPPNWILERPRSEPVGAPNS
jgi:hypothetical protein